MAAEPLLQGLDQVRASLEDVDQRLRQIESLTPRAETPSSETGTKSNTGAESRELVDEEEEYDEEEEGSQPLHQRGLAKRKTEYAAEYHDPETTTMFNLFCVWSIGFLAAIESSVSQPSLWLYVDSLGGSKRFYTVCIASFALGRFACMGIFGMWADKSHFKDVFSISLGIAMLSGILYALAPSFPEPYGLYTLPIARGVLGAMSCQTVATQAFVSQHTAPADRLRYMTINNMVSNTLSILGPAFNLIIVNLPMGEFTLGGFKLVFNSYTWVGWFLLFCQTLCLIFIHWKFTEPTDRQWQRAGIPLEGCVAQCVTARGYIPWGRLWVDPWLRLTHSYIIFMINFRNQFTVFAVTWTLPIITDRDYSFGQMENSFVFLALALESFVSSATIGWLSKYLKDRDSIALFQMISFTGLGTYVLLSGFGTRALPLPLFIALFIWYDFGVPASQVQTLYSKLIGPGGNAIYFSVLQSNGAVGRLVAAKITNLAFAGFGMPFIWGMVYTFWSLQWLVYLMEWKTMDPVAIDAMHTALLDHPLKPKKGKGKGKGKKGKGKGKGKLEPDAIAKIAADVEVAADVEAGGAGAKGEGKGKAKPAKAKSQKRASFADDAS